MGGGGTEIVLAFVADNSEMRGVGGSFEGVGRGEGILRTYERMSVKNYFPTNQHVVGILK